MNKKWSVILTGYILILVAISIVAYKHSIPHIITKIPYYDTIGHFMLFGMAALLAHRALNRRMVKIIHFLIPLGPVIIFVLVFAEEFIQRFSPYRSSSFSDLAADMCGMLFFYYLDKLFLQKRK